MSQYARGSMPVRRSRRLAVRALLVGLGLVVAAFVANELVRITDPLGISYFRDVNRYFAEAIEPRDVRPEGQLFHHRSNLALEFRTFAFHTDAAGFRCSPGAPPLAPRSEGVAGERHRVLFLGDSVTLGWGVDDEETWIRLLEREAVGPDGRPLECVNAGHLKYNTLQQAGVIEEFGPLLRPDLVVHTAIVNDLESTWEQAAPLLAPEHPDAAAVELPDPPPWYQRQIALRLPWLWGLYQFQVNRQSAAEQPGAAGGDVREHELYVAGWPGMESGLDRIRAACEGLGCPLVILDQTEPRIPDVRAWCEANEVPWIDLAFTAEERGRGIVNSVADAHANALGNRLQADRALAGLSALGLARPASGDG